MENVVAGCDTSLIQDPSGAGDTNCPAGLTLHFVGHLIHQGLIFILTWTGGL